MEKIAVLTDSCCDLSNETLTEYNIFQIPLRIIYQDKEFLDKVTITPQEVYKNLHIEVPTTSLPDMELGAKIIKDIASQGYTTILVITISSELSGTLNCIKLIAEPFTNLKFYYFDTRTLGYPEGVIVREAAKLVRQNLDIETILEKLPSVRERTQGYILVDTLDYLIKGGRLSKFSGAVGSILNVKPIIHHKDGKLYTHSKARGKKQGRVKLKEILQEYLSKTSCEVWVLNGEAVEEAQDFLSYIKDLSGITDIHLEEIGAAMGIHTGPGVIGLVVLASE
ncbi:MAG: fatty acid-binding protein DegV [Epulopiscium sp. Nuni2H_MBin003]|nr:MAG: fatty acid-binding protein DegV [Epulopiscium sp. Nuni2H_MBin003]